jgi:hypothetical protein
VEVCQGNPSPMVRTPSPGSIRNFQVAYLFWVPGGSLGGSPFSFREFPLNPYMTVTWRWFRVWCNGHFCDRNNPTGLPPSTLSARDESGRFPGSRNKSINFSIIETMHRPSRSDSGLVGFGLDPVSLHGCILLQVAVRITLRYPQCSALNTHGTL